MSKYKLTVRGKMTAVFLGILALVAIYSGTIATAAYVFIFCLVAVCLLVYDFYFNGR